MTDVHPTGGPGSRCSCAPQVAGIGGLRVGEKAVRDLKGPTRSWTIPPAHRPRVERARIHHVPSLLVRLRAAEDRAFDFPCAAVEASRQDAHGDVRRVERVMPERRRRVLEGRGPVHECNRSERRFADGRTGERQRVAARQRHPPDDRGLHHEVVGMLAIDQRPMVERLANLKKLPVAVASERRRIETEHQVEAKRAAGCWTLGHAHPPVLRRELGSAARAALMIQVQKDHAVLHELPGGFGRHLVLVFAHRLRPRGEWQGKKHEGDPGLEPFHGSEVPYASGQHWRRTAGLDVYGAPRSSGS